MKTGHLGVPPPSGLSAAPLLRAAPACVDAVQGWGCLVFGVLRLPFYQVLQCGLWGSGLVT